MWRFGEMAAAALRTMAWMAVAAAFASLAACYESDSEIIPANLAEVIPYRNSEIVWSADSRTTISPMLTGGDYRFDDDRDGETKGGSFRALRVAGDIFAAQVRYDDETTYYLLFYRVTATRVRQVEVASTADLNALAARTRVTLDDDGLGSTRVSGSPADLLAFVRGHSRLTFRDTQ